MYSGYNRFGRNGMIISIHGYAHIEFHELRLLQFGFPCPPPSMLRRTLRDLDYARYYMCICAYSRYRSSSCMIAKFGRHLHALSTQTWRYNRYFKRPNFHPHLIQSQNKKIAIPPENAPRRTRKKNRSLRFYRHHPRVAAHRSPETPPVPRLVPFPR